METGDNLSMDHIHIYIGPLPTALKIRRCCAIHQMIAIPELASAFFVNNGACSLGQKHRIKYLEKNLLKIRDKLVIS